MKNMRNYSICISGRILIKIKSIVFEVRMIDELNVKSINSNQLPGLLPTASQLLLSSLLSSPAEDKQE